MSRDPALPFDRRMRQLFGQFSDLGRGRQLRLIAPIKQEQIVCWTPAADGDIEAALKAAQRATVHELLDVHCCQLAGAFARCASEEQQALVAALAADQWVAGGCVLFREGNGIAGVRVPAKSALVVEVAPLDRPIAIRCEAWELGELLATTKPDRRLAWVDVVIDDEANDESRAPNATTIRLTSAAIHADPFACAAAIRRRLPTDLP